MQETYRKEKIEQLWYTWAPKGMESIRGFQVYAATSSLMDVNSATFRTINPYLGYDLPTGTKPSAATKENSPVCLAFINTGNQRLLLHKNFTGSDSVGRIGTYFIHLLATLPTNFIARDAIDLWYSSFWQTAVPESESGFKDAHRYELWPITADILKPEPHSEQRFLQDETVAKFLPFVIQAYLSLEQDQRLLIAADDHQVASLIWGLTHSLPSHLQQSITFSTYEAEILKSTTRIAGTSLPALEARRETANGNILPTYGNSGQYVTLNCYDSQPPSLSSHYSLLPAYAQFATNGLLGGAEASELQNLLTSAERLHVDSVKQLLLVYKLIVYKLFDTGEQETILSLEDITPILENPNFADEFLVRDNVQDALLTLAAQNPKWWENEGMQALTQLREKSIASNSRSLTRTFAALGHKAAEVVVHAITHVDQPSLNTSWTILTIVAPPAINSEPWVSLLSLLSQYHPEEICTWDLWRDLLTMWQHAEKAITFEEIQPWLSISWQQLPSFLQLKLPQKWQDVAVAHLVSGPSKSIPPSIVKFLEQPQYKQLFMRVLKQLCDSQDVHDLQDAKNFMQTLLRYGYPEKLALLNLLLNSSYVNDLMIEDLLSQVTLNQQEQLAIFKNHAAKLLSLLPTSAMFPRVQSMAKLYIDQLRVNTLISTNSEQVLTLLIQHQDKLSDELNERVFHRYLVGQAICFGKEGILPSKFTEKYLNEMGKAILELKCATDKQYRDHFYPTILMTILNEPPSERNARLLQLLKGLCTLTERKMRTDLLAEILGYLDKYPFSLDQLLPYIEVSIELALKQRTIQGQIEHLVALLKIMQKPVRNHLSAIDVYGNKQWSSEQWNVWVRASESIRPKTFSPLGVWKRNSAHVASARPTMKEPKDPIDRSTHDGRPKTEPSNQEKQEFEQRTQKPEANQSRKVTEMPQQKTSNITEERVDKTANIKLICFPYIIDLVQQEMMSKKPLPSGVGAMVNEMNDFENTKKNSHKSINKVRKELIEDEVIRSWLDKQQGKKKINDDINKDVKKITSSVEKKEQHLNQRYGRADLEEVISVYLRRFHTLKYTKNLDEIFESEKSQ